MPHFFPTVISIYCLRDRITRPRARNDNHEGSLMHDLEYSTRASDAEYGTMVSGLVSFICTQFARLHNQIDENGEPRNRL
jgi:hypothetical protein